MDIKPIIQKQTITADFVKKSISKNVLDNYSHVIIVRFRIFLDFSLKKLNILSINIQHNDEFYFLSYTFAKINYKYILQTCHYYPKFINQYYSKYVLNIIFLFYINQSRCKINMQMYLCKFERTITMLEDKEFDLLALGELLLRLSPPNNERLVQGDTFQKQVGGAELNVVSGVSLLGLRTGIISKLPANDLGTYVKNKIRFCGVSDDYLVYDKNKDARLGIYFYENGAHPRKPRIVYDRMNSSINKISISDFNEKMFSSAKCFHTSGITLALSPTVRETAIEMIKKFKEHGTIISFDVNFRGNLWNGAEAKECIEKILPYVDIFFCSEDTARLTFLKAGSLYEIMKSFTDTYPISVVASTQRTVHSPKKHSFGSVLYSSKENKYYEEKAYENIDVVDRIGSGDAYISGVLYGLLTHPNNFQKALEYGNATSSVKNTILGDLPSSDLLEIDTIIKDHQTIGKQLEMNR